MARLRIPSRSRRGMRIFGIPVMTLVIVGVVVWQWKWVKANVVDKFLKKEAPAP